MYDWRRISPEERALTLERRQSNRLPWHRLPRLFPQSTCRFFVSAACFEHKPHIGMSSERMTDFESRILAATADHCNEIFAWCVLPNHYHLLVQTATLRQLFKSLGRIHGATSYEWNLADNMQGRQVWHSAAERRIRSTRHFYCSLNYTHHNPVLHGYVTHWQDWLWSSAARFLAEIGRTQAEEIWRAYPILDFGKKWDL